MSYLCRGRAVVNRLHFRLSSTATEANTTTSAVQPSRIQDLTQNSQNISKLSLSRGLAMNKFEKDFMIFPEYSDTDDVSNITGYVSALRVTLEATSPADVEKEGKMTADVLECIKSNKLLAALVPADFGGLGMCRKDLCKIYEELGIDWNIFAHLSMASLASHLIQLYGTDKQKSHYLPKIANGDCKPGIMNVEYNNADDLIAEVIGNMGSTLNITLKNAPMISQSDPNLIIAFATTKDSHSGIRHSSCFLIDKTEIKEVDKWELSRQDTMGLKGIEVGKIDINTNLTNENVLGGIENGEEVKREIVSGRIAPLAATSVGFTKRLLNELSNYCNRSPSRINKLSRELLLETVRSSVEIFGLCSNELSKHFEKNIRDVTAILGLFTEGDTVEQISIATLSTWNPNRNRITSTIKKLFTNERIMADIKYPKLQHFIAEHAHPSLQLACQELEYSMTRVNAVIEKMMSEQGKNVAQDYGSIEALARIFENHLCMVSTISRASRSYAVGLRNADLEIAWANLIATRLSRDNWFQLDTLSDYYGLIKLNPSLTNAGRAVLDMGGYPIESPIERNW